MSHPIPSRTGPPPPPPPSRPDPPTPPPGQLDRSGPPPVPLPGMPHRAPLSIISRLGPPRLPPLPRRPNQLGSSPPPWGIGWATNPLSPSPPLPPPTSSLCLQPFVHETSSKVISGATSSTKEVGHLDLLDPRKAFSPEVLVQLTGGHYLAKQFLASEKGHKYVKQNNPTLESVKPLLDKVKEPSVLLLRGCDLLLQSPGFPFHKFNSITALEISGCPHLTKLPENVIPQMTQLQSLDFSHLQIDRLPNDIFQNAANCLRSLVLRGCSNLSVLPRPRQHLRMIEYLDLSHLPIPNLHVEFISSGIRSLILRGCSELELLLLKEVADSLALLDVSHCTSLRTLTLPLNETGIGMVLDLSHTTLGWRIVPENVSHLFFRNAKLRIPEIRNMSLCNIKVCDLSGSEDLGDDDILKNFRVLEALDLSRTGIESIRSLSHLTCLRVLLLKECTKLQQLPTIEHLENLEVIDLSGCEILGDLPQGLDKQTRLKELNLCGCKGLRELKEGLFSQMSSLEKLDLSNTDIRNLPSFADCINTGTVINHSHASAPESSSTTTPSNHMDLKTSGLSEFHLVSTFITTSGFDKFRCKFTEICNHISLLEEKLTMSGDTTTTVKRPSESMCADLEYILGKLDLLESSQNCRRSEKLLHELMSYDYRTLDHHYLLKKLLRTVAKLKVLIPPPPPPPPTPLRVEECGENLERPYYIEMEERLERGLNNHYESLTTIQRNCLLYFACLPLPISSEKVIKSSTLIHLWYGEGFFDTLLYANPTGIQSIEEIGQKILQTLQTGEFIVFNKMKKSWKMGETAQSFVITKAMEVQSFDFNKHKRLNPQFCDSGRACLLKSDISHPSSSQVWINYTKSSKHQESFNTVRTLLYIDEPVVDINTEWFSSMTNLHVLHLVNLYSEPADVVDLKFLEELKGMKQLRLLNLESFAEIEKLPNSICQLTNLRILNLAYCSNLRKLPVVIASLTNLIILDLTQCHLLPWLPKGLMSLSKLEVLKGFTITYDADGRQSKKACTLRGLLKLKSLRKLNLVVNKDSFPDATDLQVLRNMKELQNLKITWNNDVNKEEELGDAVVKGGRWKQLKCWRPHKETEEEDELTLNNTNLASLNKLVLCCFPLEIEPKWLNPTELQNLEKLYITGGSLRTLFQDNDQAEWKIKAMKLTYLSNLDINWWVIEKHLPFLKSVDQYGCPHARNFYFSKLKRKYTPSVP